VPGRPVSLGFQAASEGSVHNFVRLRFVCAGHVDLKSIGWALERLIKRRNRSDYDLSPNVEFASNSRPQQAIDDARAALALLDALDADPARQAAAIVAIRKAFP
jgi:hypothetical protein